MSHDKTQGMGTPEYYEALKRMAGEGEKEAGPEEVHTYGSAKGDGSLVPAKVAGECPHCESRDLVPVDFCNACYRLSGPPERAKPCGEASEPSKDSPPPLPAREWTLLIETETNQVASGWPNHTQAMPFHGCKLVRVREVVGSPTSDRVGDRKDLVMERDELRAETASLEVKIEGLEGEVSRLREEKKTMEKWWIGFCRGQLDRFPKAMRDEWTSCQNLMQAFEKGTASPQYGESIEGAGDNPDKGARSEGHPNNPMLSPGDGQGDRGKDGT